MKIQLFFIAVDLMLGAVVYKFNARVRNHFARVLLIIAACYCVAMVIFNLIVWLWVE